jgi:hypothetical protein
MITLVNSFVSLVLSYNIIFATIPVSINDNEMCTELRDRFETDCSTMKFCTDNNKHNGSDELQGTASPTGELSIIFLTFSDFLIKWKHNLIKRSVSEIDVDGTTGIYNATGNISTVNATCDCYWLQIVSFDIRRIFTALIFFFAFSTLYLQSAHIL